MAGCFDKGENGDTRETGGSLVDASLPDTRAAEHTVIEPGHAATRPCSSHSHTHTHTLFIREPLQCAARRLWQSRTPNELFMGRLSTLLAYYN